MNALQNNQLNTTTNPNAFDWSNYIKKFYGEYGEKLNVEDEISLLLKWNIKDIKVVNDMRKYLLKRLTLEDKDIQKLEKFMKYINNLISKNLFSFLFFIIEKAKFTWTSHIIYLFKKWFKEDLQISLNMIL